MPDYRFDLLGAFLAGAVATVVVYILFWREMMNRGRAE